MAEAKIAESKIPAKSTVLKITAALVDESGVSKATNMVLVLVVGINAKRAIISKENFGYVVESENGGALSQFPFLLTPLAKENEHLIDCGAALGDSSETPSKPQGDRYYNLKIVQDLKVGSLLTLSAGEDRTNYKIVTVEEGL